jgi:hypothetical protein
MIAISRKIKTYGLIKQAAVLKKRDESGGG